MIRRTLLTLALLAASAMLVAQQPATPMQGQAPAQADTSKAATKGKPYSPEAEGFFARVKEFWQELKE